MHNINRICLDNMRLSLAIPTKLEPSWNQHVLDLSLGRHTRCKGAVSKTHLCGVLQLRHVCDSVGWAFQLVKRHGTVESASSPASEKELPEGIYQPVECQNPVRQSCLRPQPQRIVLPESGDPRVLTAAEELTAKGLAHIVLLGQPDAVRHEAKRLNINISKVLTLKYID